MRYKSSYNQVILLSISWLILAALVSPGNSLINSERSKDQCYEGRFTREIRNCELVVPHRANNDGSFLSYSLPQYYERAISREKREAPQGDAKAHFVLAIEGEPHHIELWPNHRFMSPNLVVERRSANISQTQAKLVSDRQCHYTGNVRGHPGSRAILSACDGLAGYVRVRRGMYYIEPAKSSHPKEDGQHMHLVYRATDHPSQPQLRESTCATDDDWEKDWRDRLHWEVQNDPDFFKHSVHRRGESKHRYIECCVVADKKFIDYHKERDVESYILTLFNMVTDLYHDYTIGNMVDPILMRILYLDKEEEELDLEISRDATKTLESFCSWAEKLKPKEPNHPHHFDIAMLLTRHDICTNAMKKCSVIGLAPTAQACRKSRGCCINEDTGLLTGNVMTHEMGHTLGCTHDIPEKTGCQPKAKDGSYHVMSPYTMMNINSWSECCRKYMTTFFDTGLGDCLLNEPAESNFKLPEMPPGALYDAEYQCQERYGKTTKVCPLTGDRFCKSLYCMKEKTKCISAGNTPADGTSCGDMKWCFAGKCITAGKRPDAINGEWGSWGSWSECSRTCGGGVEMQERECDNPQPQHRGRFCVGLRKRYRICKSEPCEMNSPTFREVQCTSFNGQHGGKTWKPYIVRGHEAGPCQLICVNEAGKAEQLEERVKDGTRCKPGSRDTCVAGTCKKVGCDWVLESTAVEDECGICKGDGTGCKLVEGTYTENGGEGYQKIVTIPEGSANIKVLEVKASGNLLAVTDGNGKFLLNGDKKEQPDGQYSFGNNVMGIYTHIEPKKEELIIKGPTNQELILQTLFTGATNPGIKYSYFEKSQNASYTPNYEWEFIDWTDCTARCGGGTQNAKPECVEAQHGRVSDEFCSNITKPEPNSRECNLHECLIKWKAGEWGQCTGSEQKRLVSCIKENPDPRGEDIIEDPANCKGTRPMESQPCSEGSKGRREYTEGMTEEVPTGNEEEGQYIENGNSLQAYAPPFASAGGNGNESESECPPVVDRVGPDAFKFMVLPLLPGNNTDISEEAEEQLGDQISHKIDFDKEQVYTGEEADKKTKEARGKVEKEGDGCND